MGSRDEKKSFTYDYQGNIIITHPVKQDSLPI